MTMQWKSTTYCLSERPGTTQTSIHGFDPSWQHLRLGVRCCPAPSVESPPPLTPLQAGCPSIFLPGSVQTQPGRLQPTLPTQPSSVTPGADPCIFHLLPDFFLCLVFAPQPESRLLEPCLPPRMKTASSICLCLSLCFSLPLSSLAACGPQTPAPHAWHSHRQDEPSLWN